MTSPDPLRRWLLLIYRVPQEPPGRRTYVWRQLKQLGAVYLQQAAAILPDQPDTRVALEALAQRIRDYAGDVSLLETASTDAAWEQHLIARFNEARDAEYGEVIENVERFEDEVRREERKGRFHFAQLEDLEAECHKLTQWCARISTRDFFSTPTAADAAAALERGQQALEAFTAAVYAHEQANGDAPGAPADAEQQEGAADALGDR